MSGLFKSVTKATIADVVRSGRFVPATAVYATAEGAGWAELVGSVRELKDLARFVVADLKQMAEEGIFPVEYVAFAELSRDRLVLVHEDQLDGAYYRTTRSGVRLGIWAEERMGPEESLFSRRPRRMLK